jgi:hypothetical protein
MLEAKYGLVPPVEAAQKPVALPRTTLVDFVGKYIAFGEVLDVSLKGDQLKGHILGFSFNLEPLNETVFQPRNWLADTGLASLLGAPVDLRQLKIEFMPGDDISPAYLIVHIGGIGYEICPGYPDWGEIPPGWEELVGDYNLTPRLPSGMSASDVFGETSIAMEDGVLRMAGIVGPIIPISDTEIKILSGPFAGETIDHDPETGDLYHQKTRYTKMNPPQGR